jgi:molybdopterin-containing oxidoreductase family iron-sulfur binding subunit
MAKLNRRDFFKVVGASSAAGVVACDAKVPAEQIYPYVIQPDEVVPGLPTLFSTTCGGCSEQCSVVARHREGRVVHVGGNPDATLGHGVCSAGTASVQDTYDPDRVTAPATPWDETFTTLGAAVAKGGVAWIGRYRNASLGKVIGDFVAASGGTTVHWEPMGYEALVKATELAFGTATAPRYVLDGAHTIVSFGADFLHTWLARMDHSRGWKVARDPSSGHIAQFFAIEPRVSNTSANADTWWSARPGTEAGVARALAKLVADRRHVNHPWLAAVNPTEAADAAGIPLKKLQELADKLAAGPSVIFPGGVATAGTDATDLALATLVLNHVCGNIGHSVRLDGGRNLGAVGTGADVKALLADCAAGNIKTLFVDDLDLHFNLPADAGVTEALSKVTNLVVLSAHLPQGLPTGAIHLPVSSALESWGDGEPVHGTHHVQQPGMATLHDTRSLGNIVLAIAKAAGLKTPAATAALDADGNPVEGEETAVASTMLGMKTAVASFEAPDFQHFVAGRWFAEVFSGEGSFATWWNATLQQGGRANDVEEGAHTLAADLPAPGAGSVAKGKALLISPHPGLFDGRHANKPWIQEVPEPLTGYTWGTWAEISAKTAAELDVTNNDHLTVTVGSNTLTAQVFVSPGMRDDAVAVSAGNGHTAGGRYSKGWGANPMHLLTSSATDAHTGAIAYLGASATLARGTGDEPRRSLSGRGDMDNRPIALATSAAGVLAADDHAAPGSLAPTLKIPKDPRIDPDHYDMYPEPEHPNFRFAMSIDLDSCTGCSACEVACASENNVPVVGPLQQKRGRYMGWIRMDRFWEGEGEHPDVRIMPVMCQQCSHAPCEGVCPVLATYHNLDGLNAMIYNRCVGTRYCANNCPYSARRFNYHTFRWPDAYSLMLNPDVSIREMGVMEKCTFCVQRIRSVKYAHRVDGTGVEDNEIRRLTACADACPADAISFGNLQDESSEVYGKFQDPRAYTLLGELNTKPGVRYLAKVQFHDLGGDAHGSGHDDAGSEHSKAQDGHGSPS